MEYITPRAMAALEKGAVNDGLPVEKLMENAGKGVAQFVLEWYGEARRVCVVCGAGNNGGDGFVAARYLSNSCEVSIVLLARPDKIRTQEAKENWKRLASTDAELLAAEDLEGLAAVASRIARAEVVVSAIFGTGVNGGQVKEPYAAAISMINKARGAKVAVDLPSGLDPETGVPSSPTVRADVTLALHMPKVGLKGRKEYTGEVVIIPIGLRREER